MAKRRTIYKGDWRPVRDGGRVVYYTDGQHRMPVGAFKRTQQHRRKVGYPLGDPGGSSGKGFIIIGGLAVAAGITVLAVRAANAAGGGGALTPAQQQELLLHPEARSGAQHFNGLAFGY